MADQNFFMRIGNSFMKFILSSPLHGMLSRNFMLISVTGRKSGKTYTTPVNYQRQGEALLVVSMRDRTWWRNLRGGAPVTMRLQGKVVAGMGKVMEDDREIADALDGILKQTPQVARYLGIKLDPNGKPAADELNEAAKSKVIVEITLS